MRLEEISKLKRNQTKTSYEIKKKMLWGEKVCRKPYHLVLEAKEEEALNINKVKCTYSSTKVKVR